MGEFGSITGGRDAPAVLGSDTLEACGWWESLLSILLTFRVENLDNLIDLRSSGTV